MERTALPALADLRHWRTPDGLMLAVVLEQGAGRICLVDIVGRVHRYDAAGVSEIPDPAHA